MSRTYDITRLANSCSTDPVLHFFWPAIVTRQPPILTADSPKRNSIPIFGPPGLDQVTSDRKDNMDHEQIKNRMRMKVKGGGVWCPTQTSFKQNKTHSNACTSAVQK